MDDSHFRTFLDYHENVFHEFDLLLRGSQSGISELPNPCHSDLSIVQKMFDADKSMQTRFDDACRRLAEAYVSCNDRQRGVLRELLRELQFVAASLAVSPNKIRVKIDGPLFRLALIYESIKNMCPDPREATRRLEKLRQAALEAGIDPNPYLREAAEISSDVRLVDRRSMREMMRSLLLDEPSHRCHRCIRGYSSESPKCPHCGAANSAFVHMVRASIGVKGETGLDYSNCEMVRYMPTPRLISYALLSLALTIFVIMTFCQISYTFIYDNYHETRGAWSCKATILVLFGVLACFRSSLVAMAKEFMTSPTLRVTWTQVLLLIGLSVSLFVATVTILVFFDRDLGW